MAQALGTLILLLGIIVFCIALVSVIMVILQTRRINKFRNQKLHGVSQQLQDEAQAYINQQITKKQSRNFGVYALILLLTFLIAGYVFRMFVTSHSSVGVMSVVVAVIYFLIAIFAGMSRNVIKRTQQVYINYQRQDHDVTLPLVVLPDQLLAPYLKYSTRVSTLMTVSGLFFLLAAILMK
ncbi:hypothetical protein [Lacticaseibacillus jixiensis]|uniref:hypothetical protein n=1 Tax=Lacticaseibacillus jixiensis TaxID=3231926 RepID=UPI0036F35F25